MDSDGGSEWVISDLVPQPNVVGDVEEKAQGDQNKIQVTLSALHFVISRNLNLLLLLLSIALFILWIVLGSCMLGACGCIYRAVAEHAI